MFPGQWDAFGCKTLLPLPVPSGAPVLWKPLSPSRFLGRRRAGRLRQIKCRLNKGDDDNSDADEASPFACGTQMYLGPHVHFGTPPVNAPMLAKSPCQKET